MDRSAGVIVLMLGSISGFVVAVLLMLIVFPLMATVLVDPGDRALMVADHELLRQRFEDGYRPEYVENIGTVWYNRSYEYQWIARSTSDASEGRGFVDWLNTMGKDGWMLVTYDAQTEQGIIMREVIK